MANSTLNGGGMANITINNANVTLNGVNSTFTFINNFTTNNGTFALAGTRSFVTSISTPFTNTGHHHGRRRVDVFHAPDVHVDRRDDRWRGNVQCERPHDA